MLSCSHTPLHTIASAAHILPFGVLTTLVTCLGCLHHLIMAFNMLTYHGPSPVEMSQHQTSKAGVYEKHIDELDCGKSASITCCCSHSSHLRHACYVDLAWFSRLPHVCKACIYCLNANTSCCDATSSGVEWKTLNLAQKKLRRDMMLLYGTRRAMLRLCAGATNKGELNAVASLFYLQVSSPAIGIVVITITHNHSLTITHLLNDHHYHLSSGARRASLTLACQVTSQRAYSTPRCCQVSRRDVWMISTVM